MNGITDLRASYSGLRAFVFGASGFIGRRVVRMLLDCGAQVYPVVRSQTAASQFSSHPSLCDTVACDLRNTAELRDVLTRLRPAIVFNLAAYGVNPAERDAETAYAINAHAPVDICRALCGYSVPEWPGVRLVHAGSALEYGSAAGDLSEVSTAQPATLYGCSKLEGTVQIAREASRTGLRACTARLFMVYGPGERAHRLLPTLIRAARTGATVPLTTGLQRRDFVYVDDVAEGLLRIGISPARPGEVINLATGNLTSIRDFVQTAAEVLGIAATQIRFGALPTRQEEMCHDAVSIARLKQLASWSPQTEPAEGVRRTALNSGGRRSENG